LLYLSIFFYLGAKGACLDSRR